MPRICEETGLEIRTVTFGVMPDKAEFDRRWEVAMGNRRYTIRGAESWTGSYSREELWARFTSEIAAWDALTDDSAQEYDDQNRIAMVGDILSAHFAWEWV